MDSIINILKFGLPLGIAYYDYTKCSDIRYGLMTGGLVCMGIYSISDLIFNEKSKSEITIKILFGVECLGLPYYMYRKNYKGYIVIFVTLALWILVGEIYRKWSNTIYWWKWRVWYNNDYQIQADLRLRRAIWQTKMDRWD